MPYDTPMQAGSTTQVREASDTELTRSSIESHLDELTKEIAELSDKLNMVLRPELASGPTKDGPMPPRSTVMHGWLCETRDRLASQISALRSLNSRIEV